MTDVKLFDENAHFQVKGLHMRGKLKICNAFYFSFCKGRKKERIENNAQDIRNTSDGKHGHRVY